MTTPGISASAGASGGTVPAGAAPYDPLRLCVYATIALLGWLGGPVTLLVFAVLGLAGYGAARRAGLRRSRCFLRDTRLVLTYLGILAAAGAAGVGLRLASVLP